VTFTDDRLNAQIQLRRTQNGLDRGRSIVTSEQEQTAAQKRGADASGLTPERKTAVQPDGQVDLCWLPRGTKRLSSSSARNWQPS